MALTEWIQQQQQKKLLKIESNRHKKAYDLCHEPTINRTKLNFWTNERDKKKEKTQRNWIKSHKSHTY